MKTEKVNKRLSGWRKLLSKLTESTCPFALFWEKRRSRYCRGRMLLPSGQVSNRTFLLLTYRQVETALEILRPCSYNYFIRRGALTLLNIPRKALSPYYLRPFAQARSIRAEIVNSYQTSSHSLLVNCRQAGIYSQCQSFLFSGV